MREVGGLIDRLQGDRVALLAFSGVSEPADDCVVVVRAGVGHRIPFEAVDVDLFQLANVGENRAEIRRELLLVLFVWGFSAAALSRKRAMIAHVGILMKTGVAAGVTGRSGASRLFREFRLVEPLTHRAAETGASGSGISY